MTINKHLPYPFKFTVLVLIFLCGCANTNNQNSISYVDARNLAIENGWTPTDEFLDEAIQNAAQEYDYTHPLLKLGYNELGACTGMGVALCDFYFKNNKNQYLRVITQGENFDPDAKYPAYVIYLNIASLESIKNETDPYRWDVIGDGEARQNYKKLAEILE